MSTEKSRNEKITQKGETKVKVDRDGRRWKNNKKRDKRGCTTNGDLCKRAFK
jgi:hypothetical protein